MKAMILAAGLGTRLKPWTLEHPKALVPVHGVPMLERVIRKLESEGFRSIVVNIHHFGEQIIDFINSKEWKASVVISDERGELLDTGGGIKFASRLLDADSAPFLVHNVDILSSAPLGYLMKQHENAGNDVSLIVSNRESSRKLIVDSGENIVGWHNVATGELRRGAGISESDWCRVIKYAGTDGVSASDDFSEYSFSGIHIMNPRSVFAEMDRLDLNGKFPVMDLFLNRRSEIITKGIVCDSLRLIDIGKPETLARAQSMLELL